jgi:hypothetical protein
MKLRSVSLTNVRRFAGQTAVIRGIGDGISVIAEPNEFGKSTFFDALHALFFLPFGSKAGGIKALVPEPSGGPVEIAVEIELPGGLFRVEKRFMSRAQALVTDLTRGVLVGRDDEAEAWLRTVMDQGLNGPAGLLWVRQGVTTLNAGDKAENARHLGQRRNLLSSVAGEIAQMTGGRRMDRVRDRCRVDLEQLSTTGGKPKAGSPWKEARDEVAALTERVAVLSGKVAELSGALERRRIIEARLAVLEAPEARAGRAAALAAAETADRVAQAHAAKVAEAESRVKIAALTKDDLAGRLAGLLRSFAAVAEAGQAAARASEADGVIGARLEEALAAQAVCEGALAGASARLKAARETVAAAQRRMAAARARADLARVRERLASAEAQRALAEQAEAVVAQIAATPQRVEALETAFRQAERARDALEAQSVKVQVHYAGAARVLRDGVAVPEGVVALDGRAVFDLPGIGMLAVDPGAVGRGDAGAVARAEAEEAKALAVCGVTTVEAARVALRERAEAIAAGKLAAGVMKSLAPEGLQALRALVAQTATVAGDAADDGVEPDLAGLEAAVVAAEGAEAEARVRAEAAGRTVAGLTAERAGARVALSTALSVKDAAETAAGDLATRVERQAQTETAAAQAGAELAGAQAVVAGLVAGAPDLATVRAELSRAKGAIEAAETEVARLRLERERLAGTIQSQAADAVEEKLAEAQGALEAARERDGRYAAEVAALIRLGEVIEATRAAAQDAYFEPVQKELAPLLAILAQDAALTFDPESLLPGQLMRNGGALDVERLSGGTQEQIAILTRLAFARLFAKAGRPVPVILDDALVHTDDARIVRMFTALHRVAAEQQVIVFTCRQMAFEALGGHRPEVVVG